MSTNGNVPENVEIAYRVVGGTHVFSSKGIEGLLHVGSKDRRDAFERVIPALNTHVAEAYGCEVAYVGTVNYDEFASHVDGGEDILANFLNFRLDRTLAACV